jgi:pilus assembly protein CpaD
MIRVPIAACTGIGAAAARLAMAASIAALLAGCHADREIIGSVPNDVRQRHPIAIREGAQTVEIFVGSNRGSLTPAQRADVLAYAHSWKRDATGGVVIEVPAGTSNEVAAAQTLREIRSILHAGGVPGYAIDVRPYRPRHPLKLATIRLNYPKMIATAGPCGLWPNDLGVTLDPSDIQNRPYWNFGCAYQRNMAAMVENPADLVQPRGEAPALAGRRSIVLEKYRKGESTATIYPDANKGKISTVGQ